MSNKRYNLAKKILCKFTDDVGNDEELLDIARRMAIADVEDMGVEAFISQKASDISLSFMDICVNTMQQQLSEILTLKKAEGDLDDLGIGGEQERVDLASVSRALHNNYASGMAVMTNYFSMLENVKNHLDEL